MAANTNPIFVLTPKSPGTTLSTTTLTTLHTAGANGAFIGKVWVYADSSYSGTSGKIQLWLNDGTDRLLGEASLTASTAIDLLNGIYCPTEIQMQASAILKVKVTSISAGNVYATVTSGGDY